MAVDLGSDIGGIRWILPVRTPQDAETENRTAIQMDDALSRIERDRREPDPVARDVVAADEYQGRLALVAATASTRL